MLAAAIVAFAAANSIAPEAGLMATTTLGVVLANQKLVPSHEFAAFSEDVGHLILGTLFIVLGARLNPADILATGWQGVILLVVVLLARPVVVWAAMVGGEYSWQQKALVAWVGPRGIVAAAVSSIFALRLQEAGFSDAFMLVPYTFLIIIFTVVLQSVSARPMAKFLGLMEEEPKGILIAGANSVSRTIGLALAAQGFRVKLTDTNWSTLSEARMAGLDTYYGNLVSVHADQHLDLAGIGRLFAMSPRPSFNTLACLKYKTEFGAQRVFTLRNAEEKDESDKQRVAQHYQAPRLFGEDVTMQKLSSLIAQGAEIKATLLSDDFDLETYRQANDKNIILLFAMDPQERLRAFTNEYAPEVQAGWTLLTLVPSAEE